MISLAGHGLETVASLQVPAPLCDCMRPGFRTPKFVVGARTQPLLSCMMIAKMKRASMPVEEATDWMLLDISDISSSVLSATPHCVQELDMTPLFAANLKLGVLVLGSGLVGADVAHMVSKSETQSLMAGQPSAVVPSPPKTAYEVALSRSLRE